MPINAETFLLKYVKEVLTRAAVHFHLNLPRGMFRGGGCWALLSRPDFARPKQCPLVRELSSSK
jgi:hypothetical protein